MTDRHCCPRLFRGRGYAWATCHCGWTSPEYRTVLGAAYAWACHVRDSR